MTEDIKKNQKVILFPEDPEINLETKQEVIISEEAKYISIEHDGECLWMSIENYVKLTKLIESAFMELGAEKCRQLLKIEIK
jgi:hypothetical protein